MEFWGAEVKSGQIFEVELEEDGNRILHISQVALGEVTGDNKKGKGNGDVCIYLKFNNEKFVIGTLSREKFPQMQLDLVLNGKFELSHTGKKGSIYFTGYYVDTTQGGDSESEDELLEPTVNPLQHLATASDPTTSKQIKIVEPNKKEDSSDDEDEDDTSTEDEVSSDDQEAGLLVNGENESDDDTDNDDDSEEESSDEDQETSEAEEAGPSKKRSAESATKTPAPLKKAKLVTPQKTDGKKVGGHTATPHPLKNSGKASATTSQAKQSSNSGSSFLCKSCGRSFGSENASQYHSQAKHGSAI